MKSVSIVISDRDGEIPNHPWSKQVSEGGMSRMAGQAVVKYATGIKINIGNYQSATVDVGIELPSDVENIDETYDKAVEWVNERFIEEVSGIEKLKKGGK